MSSSSAAAASSSSAAAASSSNAGSRLRRIYRVSDWQRFFDEVKATHQLMVIFFSAMWCGPSGTIWPVVADLANTYKDVVFVKIDADQLFPVAYVYNINETVPQFIAVKHGVELDRVVGAKADKLIAMIERHR